KVDSFTGALKLAAKVVPGVGTAAAVAQVTSLLLEVATETRKLILELQRGIEALVTFIEFCQDPIGFAKGRAEGKVKEELKPFTDFVGEVKGYQQLATDAATATDVGRVTRTPTTPYDPGSEGRLWEDAS
ncbi:hypothetical protein G3I15_22335, partial [Streptomyces sp. SID10244]|nr:hypothetical protein [Streptomyces sp. SID10244]